MSKVLLEGSADLALDKRDRWGNRPLDDAEASGARPVGEYLQVGGWWMEYLQVGGWTEAER